MSCLTELQLLALADDELSAREQGPARDHLARCATCRALGEALGAENRLLVRVLDEAAEAAPVPRGAAAELATVGLVLFAAVAGFEALRRWLAELGQGTPGGLVDGRSFVINVVFDALLYLLREGASMFNSMLTTFGFVALILVTALLVARRRRWITGSLLLALAVAGPPPAAALERRVARDDHASVVVRADESIDDSLLAVGDTVSMEGTVTGNLIALARRVTVRGTVKGDLVTAAARVDIEGTVEGNVLSFSETVTLRGPVGKSFHGCAKRVQLEREGRVEGDAVTFAAETNLDGRVGRDLLAFAGQTEVRGEVARHLSAWTGRLHVEGPARIGGNLTAHVEKKGDLVVDPQATVAGKTEARVDTKPRRSRYAQPGFYLWKAIWLAAAFVTGLLAQRVFPSFFALRLTEPGSVSRSLSIGVLAMFGPPLAILIVGLTMVGLPLALIALGLWIVGLYLSSIVASAWLGRKLLAPSTSFAVSLLLGLLIVTVAANLPYVGALVHSVFVVLGLGMLALQIWRASKPAPAVS